MYNQNQDPEQILIRKARRGDAKAFSELYAQIYQELYRFALFTMRHSQDAEDVVSEAVAAAYENISKLRREESFRSWIFTILANQCRRKLKTEMSAERLQEETEAPEQNYAEQCDVRAAFTTLDAVDRLILNCSILEGYSSEEIGRRLEMNPATVRSRKARALEKLRGLLV